MSIRPTSWQAYKSLEESGKLSARRMEVLWYVFHNPNTTSLECSDYFLAKNPKIGNALHTGHSPRYSELVRAGFLYESGRKLYKGHNRITYDVTGKTDPVINKKPRELGTSKKKLVYLKEALEDISYRCEHVDHLTTKNGLAYAIHGIATIALNEAGVK